MFLKFIILSCCLINLTLISARISAKNSAKNSVNCVSSGSSGSSDSSGSASSSSSGSSSSSCGSTKSSPKKTCSSGCTSCSGSVYNYADYTYKAVPLPPGVSVGILDSPSYDCRTRSLYFSDLFGIYIFRYSELTGGMDYTSIPGYPQISFVIPTKNDPTKMVIGCNNSVYLMQWNGRTGVTPTILKKILTLQPDTQARINQAIAGPNGDLYTGTFNPKLCGAPPYGVFAQYKHKTGKLEMLEGNYITTNTLAYNCKTSTLYHNDGCQQQLYASKLDPKTGELSDRQLIKQGFGQPPSVATVGLSINTRGHMFIDTYRNGTMYVIDSATDQLIQTLQLPTPGTTSSAWGGGCDLDRLYVLTSTVDVDILTAQPTGVIYPPPGGQLLIMHGFGKGLPTNKPIVCSNTPTADGPTANAPSANTC